MRNFAVIATTAILLGLAGTAAAQELTGSSSGGSSSGPSAMTASPGQSAPAGTTSSFVPPPSHPSSTDYIPQSSESNHSTGSRSHGAALVGGGSSNNAKSGNDDGGYRVNFDGASNDNTEDLYDENGEPFSRQYYQGYPINLRLALLRSAGLQPGQVTLHIAAPFQVTTCAKLSNIPDTVTYSNDSLKIELKKITRDIRDLNDDPGYNCVSTTQDTPAADILLDSAELKKHNTKTIELTTASGTTDHYDVTLTDHMIRLQPVKDEGVPSVGPSHPGVLRNPLQHWFYPPGTVVVYVPDVPHGQDINDELDRAVRARGLVPLTDLWPEFKSPLTVSRLRYYVDKSDKVMKGVPEGETIAIGNLTINKTVYGLQGDEIEQKDLPIYARTPNTYE